MSQRKNVTSISRCRSWSGITIFVALAITCTFGTTIWLLSAKLSNLGQADNIAVIDYTGVTAISVVMRVEKFRTWFPFFDATESRNCIRSDCLEGIDCRQHIHTKHSYWQQIIFWLRKQWALLIVHHSTEHFLSSILLHRTSNNASTILHHELHSGAGVYGDLRVITVHNMFPHHISLNFDDSEAGSFLTIIDSQEISKVKACSGNWNNCHTINPNSYTTSNQKLFNTSLNKEYSL